jgi:hypothetical protein
VRIPPYTLLPFGQLVDQVWGVLRQTYWVSFPTTNRAHPAGNVLVNPVGVLWPGDFWQGIVVPTMTTLLGMPPTYPGGWANPMARMLVSAHLRSTLSGSSWESWMDFTR